MDRGRQLRREQVLDYLYLLGARRSCRHERRIVRNVAHDLDPVRRQVPAGEQVKLLVRGVGQPEDDDVCAEDLQALLNDDVGDALELQLAHKCLPDPCDRLLLSLPSPLVRDVSRDHDAEDDPSELVAHRRAAGPDQALATFGQTGSDTAGS